MNHCVSLIHYNDHFFFIDSTGAREFVRRTRGTGPDDLLNSAIGGFGSGAILGRLQGQFPWISLCFFQYAYLK